MDKKIRRILEEDKTKRKMIRLPMREHTDRKSEQWQTGAYKGSVWAVPDRSVPFDEIRKAEQIKPEKRPCLILETPSEFGEYKTAHIAPGTSVPHRLGKKSPPCLLADRENDGMKKDTYFLIYFRWFAVQKTMEKRIGEISFERMKLLDKILAAL